MPELLEPTPERPLKVAWFSYFPIEWLSGLPPELQGLPRLHPASWQRVLWEELKNDRRLKLHIIVLRNSFPRTQTFEKDGTHFHCVRTPPGLRAGTLYWLDTLSIRRELKKIRPDLVHGWGTEFGGAAVAGRVPYPALITMQGILTWCATMFPLNRHMKISLFLEPGSLRRAKIATCESSFAMHYLRERYPHLKLLQVEHAPDPVFAAVQRQPLMSPPRIVCVSSFLYAKGADVLLKALDGLVAKMDFELLWIGSRNTELEQSLRAETSPQLWNKVQFKHNLTPKEVAAELAAATLLVHPSRADNSPNSVKEAAVAGVPVVATETGGIPDYISAGKNGFLFKSGDVEECRENLVMALTHPLFAKGQVDPVTLENVRGYLSANTMAVKFYEAYRTTLRVWKA